MSDNVKPVSFKRDDEDIKKYLKDNGYHKTFSYYVKGLIRKDMLSKNFKPSIEEEKEKPNRRRNAKFVI